MPVPFVIYADFESILVPEEERSGSKSSEDESSTNLYQTDKACSFGLKTVCHYDDKYTQVSIRATLEMMLHLSFSRPS
jgi:hypothetical protein